ncbi:MAG: cyclic lactone autoinducer peptide [Lachnospiraceae bacterium]|nr:cyclic lactone autoinducer peptide [Lachnospiraceae bacterium]
MNGGRLRGAVLANCMAIFAIVFSYISAYAKCFFVFHQPEKPDLSKLRRF